MDEKVVVGIVIKEDKVLIVRRKKGEGDLLWQFPGGTVEQGETFEEAVIRELREETGIRVSVKERLGERIHPYTKKYMAYFGCEYIDGELHISDADLDQIEWVDKNKLEQYFTTPIYEAAAEYLQK